MESFFNNAKFIFGYSTKSLQECLLSKALAPGVDSPNGKVFLGANSTISPHYLPTSACDHGLSPGNTN